MKKLLALVLLCACGTPALAQCRLAAAQKLPLDNPDALTLGDVKALAKDLKACTATADAGPAL